MTQYRKVGSSEHVGFGASRRIPEVDFVSDIERGSASLGDAIAEDVTAQDAPWMKVWMAVIIQALKDATANVMLEKPDNAARALYRRNEALAWLRGDSDDFLDICERAGLEPGAVRRRADDIISGREEFNRRVDPVESAKRRRLTLTHE